MTGALRIGTSGWMYPHWRGRFYPPEAPTAGWLPAYATTFDMVEVNNSFYRLPTRDTFARWASKVPSGFRFAVKASRFLTHRKKLREPAEPIERLLAAVAGLGPSLGPILFQLPPRWRFDRSRLADFLDALPVGPDYTLEFRDPTWLVDEAYDLLARHGVALCLYDLAGFVTPDVVTAPFVYVRLHGPDGKYAGSYDDAALRAWLAKSDGWRAEGRDTWFAFDNDTDAAAPRDALRLRHLAGQLG